jgi:hypothetical protein
VHPSEHFIVAVLPTAAYVIARDRALPTPQFLAVVFVGSQLPDLVDKPLAHQFGLLPSGRVFLHSIPIALPLVGLVLYYAYRTDRLRLGGAYAFAHATHLLADNHSALRDPTRGFPPDLLWPFTQPAPRPLVPWWAGPDGINVLLWTLFSAAVLAVLLYVLGGDLRSHAHRWRQ